MAIGNTLSSRLIHKGKWVMGTRSVSSWWSSVDPAPKHPVTKAEKVNVGLVKGRFPFFDMAYQGFAPERDAKSIWNDHRLGIAQSYAKNMDLYSQRVGCSSVVCESQNEAVAGKRNQEVKVMADRIIGMRTALPENFEKLGSLLSRKHITNQIGMNKLIARTYSGLAPEPEQVNRPHLRVLSPHLPVYEPQRTSTLSIFNRISGEEKDRKFIVDGERGMLLDLRHGRET